MLGAATFPALLPTFVDEWQLSKTDAGWINGIYFAGYLLAVPVLTSLTDRQSPRLIYCACLVITALSSFAFALLAKGFWTAMLFRTLAGIGLAGTYMPGLKLLNDQLDMINPGGDHSRSVAFYTSSFGIGTSISILMAGEIATAYSWQLAFLISGIGPALGLMLLLWALPKKHSQDTAAPTTHLLDFRPVLKCRAAMAYVVAYTLHNFELFAFRSWLVAYLIFAASTGPDRSLFVSATAIAAFVNLLGMPSSVMGNELSRRFGRHKVISLIMIVSALIGFIIGFMAGAPLWVITLLVMVYGVTITADSSAITAGVVASAPTGYKGATMAVHSSIGFVGSFAGPLVFGMMLDLADPGNTGGTTIDSWGWAFAFSGATIILGPLFLATMGRSK